MTYDKLSDSVYVGALIETMECDDYSRPADEAAWALAKTGMKEADDALQAAGLPSLARIVAQAYWRPQP